MSEQVNIIEYKVNKDINNSAVEDKILLENIESSNFKKDNGILKSQAVQYAHQYVKQTGDCSIFPELVKHLKSNELTKIDTSSDTEQILNEKENSEVSEAKSIGNNSELSATESEANQKSGDKEEKLSPLQRVEMARSKIACNCLEITTVTQEISQLLRVGDRSTLSTQDLYRASIQPVAIAGDEGLIYLRRKLDEEKYQLGNNINVLLEMSRTCCNCRDYKYFVDGNGGMELHSMDETTAIVKLARDLRYFLAYIQEEAKISKIEKDLRRIYDPAVYFQRLHQYLEDLPQTANNLVDAISKKLVK